LGNLTEKAADFVIEEIHKHCKHPANDLAGFSVWKDHGGVKGSMQNPPPRDKPRGKWQEVAARAKEVLDEGRESGLISNREEIGYMGAIAIIEDSKSRPADKKGAIDLIMRLEGIFEDRNKGVEAGDEAEGTKALIDKMKGADGKD